MKNYSTGQIAAAAGVHARTVRRFLWRHYPGKHYRGQWWRLDANEYQISVNALRCAKIVCPGQPLRAMESGQSFLPLWG